MTCARFMLIGCLTSLHWRSKLVAKFHQLDAIICRMTTCIVFKKLALFPLHDWKKLGWIGQQVSEIPEIRSFLKLNTASGVKLLLAISCKFLIQSCSNWCLFPSFSRVENSFLLFIWSYLTIRWRKTYFNIIEEYQRVNFTSSDSASLLWNFAAMINFFKYAYINSLSSI